MPRKSNKQRTKLYTYSVSVTFEMQFTFTSDEVERDYEGDANSFEPTDKALTDLEHELREYLFESYPVESVEVSTDSALLLGVSDAPVKPKPPSSKAKKGSKKIK